MAWFRKKKYTTLQPPAKRSRIPQGLWTKCPRCAEQIPAREWEENLKVCTHCGHHERLPAHTRIEQIVDECSFAEHDRELASTDPLGFKDSKPYGERLEAAREATGLTEGVVTGSARIHGRPVSIAVMDMAFIGGSMGIAVGEKIARAMERALEGRMPMLLVCCSGGARMQEGVLSLMQMAKTCAIAAKLHAARVPMITLLTDPTTGGVSASFALLGDIVLAEPGALIGFAGQRVIEQTIKQILPPGFQRAEFLADHGFVDIVCKRRDLRMTLGNLIMFFTHAQAFGDSHATGAAAAARAESPREDATRSAPPRSPARAASSA